MSARRADTPVAPGSRRRESDTLGYIPPIREPRLTARAARSLTVLVLTVAWLAGSAAALTSVVAIDVPGFLPRTGSAVLTVVFVATLTHRCGGRIAVVGPLTAVAVAAAAYFELNWMYATMAVLAAVSSAVLAVMITRPARTVLGVVREFSLSVLVAVSGALAVAGWNAPVVYHRFYLLVLGLALLLTISVVWVLGAGLHGLGRRGFLLILAGAIAMALVLVYSSAVRAYGSQSVVDALDHTITWLRDTIGGVPRPAEVLIGFPALIWGISTRSTRRQGWWMCSFGVVGMGVITTSLASPNALPKYVALSTLYSVVLGLVVGLVLRRLGPGSTGAPSSPPPTGRRARREDAAPALRPEPARTRPLR